MNINKVFNIEITNFNFFYLKSEFLVWADRLNPFSLDNPINKLNNLKIEVNSLSEKIIGYNYIIKNQDEKVDFLNVEYNLPDFETIQQYVHILSKEKFVFNPKKFLVLNARYNKYSAPFFRMSSSTLSAAITSEIIDSNNIILRGVRKIDLELFENNHLSLDIKFIDELRRTVEWIYEEKTELRLKLFLERVTLDINLHKKYVNELILINKISFEQAKERYSFALFERKDQYQKELRELLKDLKTISDLYSIKTRTVLTNMLRDVLAGFFLIAITMFSRIDNLDELFTKPTIIYVFRGFSIYFIVSIIYQVIIDWFDIIKTEKEFNYWKKTGKEYLSEEDFNKHKKNTLDERRSGTIFFYVILSFTYLTIAYFAWNFKDIFTS